MLAYFYSWKSTSLVLALKAIIEVLYVGSHILLYDAPGLVIVVIGIVPAFSMHRCELLRIGAAKSYRCSMHSGKYLMKSKLVPAPVQERL